MKEYYSMNRWICFDILGGLALGYSETLGSPESTTLFLSVRLSSMRLIGTGQFVPDLACLSKIEMTQDDPWQAHNVVLSALQCAHQVKSLHLSRVVTVEQG